MAFEKYFLPSMFLLTGLLSISCVNIEQSTKNINNNTTDEVVIIVHNYKLFFGLTALAILVATVGFCCYALFCWDACLVRREVHHQYRGI